MIRELMERVKDDIYVDHLVAEGEIRSEVDKIKCDSVNLLQTGGFKLHKWHSNEQANYSVNEKELNFAKQDFGRKPKKKTTRAAMGQKERFLHYSSTEC